jgi:hypothetical protein
MKLTTARSIRGGTLLILGFCSSLLVITAAADSSGLAAPGSRAGGADADAAEQDADSVISSAGDDPRDSAPVPTGDSRRPASTATAASILNKKVKEGKIKIEGDADTAAPP